MDNSNLLRVRIHTMEGNRFMKDCNHDNVCIEKACCNGNNCDCRGMDTIYCADCDYVFEGDEAYDIYAMNWSLE